MKPDSDFMRRIPFLGRGDKIDKSHGFSWFAAMLPRDAEFPLRQMLEGFPVATDTGPRQSGKTTRVKALFTDKPYVSVENPDSRRMALDDPRAFLGRSTDGGIIDEIQRAPELLSYLQTQVDADGRMGLFLLTGSQQFGLMSGITHPLRKSAFETFVVSELVRNELNRGRRPSFYFWRDSNGNEIDVIVEAGDRWQPIEIKSGQTLNRDVFTGPERWTGSAKERAVEPTLIYGGTEAIERRGVRIFGWNAVKGALGA